MKTRPPLLDAEACSLIAGARVAHLATIARQGEPHLVPVCFAFVASHFYIPVDEKPKRGGTLARIRNIQRDPRATLLIDRYEDDWTQLAWLRFDCLAHVVDSGGQRPDVVEALELRYPQYLRMSLGERPLVELVPQRYVSWRWPTGEAR